MSRIGQKVVCVDATPLSTAIGYGRFGERGRLVKGEIYTISGFTQDVEGECVFLAEIANIDYPGEIDVGYLARRFRPLVEKKTDISIFTKMLKSNKKKVDA